MKSGKIDHSRFREMVLYVFFGVVTTVVNLVVFKFSNLLLGEDLYLISNIIAWFMAVVAAYVTNKLWVFDSKSWALPVLLREIPSFFAARVFSFLIEEAGLYLMVDLLHFGELSVTVCGFTVGGQMIAKVILMVIVVILNYFFSKLFIFRREAKPDSDPM